MRAWLFWGPIAWLSVGAAACSGGDDPLTTDAVPASSSGTDSSTGGEPTPDPTTSTSNESLDSSGDSGPGPLDTGDSSSGGGDSESGTDTGCPPGTEGCPCDSGRCDGRLACIDDTCQTFRCDADMHEANEDESTAVFLGMINDNDANGDTLSGSLHHPGDVDWYYYQGDDDITGQVNPSREVVSDGGLRFCKFLECDNGLAETSFECPPGTDYALSPMARAGCCSDGTVELDGLNCTGVTEDNAMVYMRVDMPDGGCVNYSVAYHY